MSQIAAETGIGRATLYKYFPDVEAILVAWHERQVHAHLERLAAVRDRAGAAGGRLAAVLEAYARIAHESRAHHGAALGEVAARLHRDERSAHGGEHVARARRQLLAFLRDLLAEGAETGEVRADVAPDELAVYCLRALGGAGG